MLNLLRSLVIVFVILFQSILLAQTYDIVRVMEVPVYDIPPELAYHYPNPKSKIIGTFKFNEKISVLETRKLIDNSMVADLEWSYVVSNDTGLKGWILSDLLFKYYHSRSFGASYDVIDVRSVSVNGIYLRDSLYDVKLKLGSWEKIRHLANECGYPAKMMTYVYSKEGLYTFYDNKLSDFSIEDKGANVTFQGKFVTIGEDISGLLEDLKNQIKDRVYTNKKDGYSIVTIPLGHKNSDVKFALKYDSVTYILLSVGISDPGC